MHPQHIRSFVNRRSHMTQGQQQALDSYLDKWSISYRAEALDLSASFGRVAPTILEIGFGMGETTAKIAALRSEPKVAIASTRDSSRRCGASKNTSVRSSNRRDS